MATPKALVVKGPGTNCDGEVIFACERAGFSVETVLLGQALEQPTILRKYQMFVIPGGFTYGDDLGAGTVFANEIRIRLKDELTAFIDRGNLIFGPCNGFQILVKSGLLPNPHLTDPTVTLAWNDSGKFEDRWIRMKIVSTKCKFLTQPGFIELPIAHGEGKFLPRDQNVLDVLKDQIVLKYVDAQGNEAGYPHNPNGSVANIAGICDPTGNVLGLMPHPERFYDITQHPEWTRRKDLVEPDGMIFFKNAFRAVS